MAIRRKTISESCPAFRPLIGSTDLSKALGINPESIRKMIAKGIIPEPLRIGSHLKWKPSAVAHLVDFVNPADVSEPDAVSCSDSSAAE